MNTPLSERPAETQRPARRSLAELAAMLASGAVVEKLPARQPVASTPRGPATAADDNAGVMPARGRQGMINGQVNEAPGASAAPVLLNTNRMGSRLDEDRTSQQLDEATLAAARSARHYRSSMLEDLKVHIITAPKDGSGVARPNPAPEPAGQPREQEKTSVPPKLERPLPAARADAQNFAADHRAKDFQTKACELINANLNAGLEYARLLANARSPFELVELSTNHAREHYELIIKHVAALAALSRSMMSAGRTTGGSKTK